MRDYREKLLLDYIYGGIHVPQEFQQNSLLTATLELPKSSLIEFFGNSGVGKTSYILTMINYLQWSIDGFTTVYIDNDKTLYDSYLDKHKINKNRLIVSRPVSVEECFSVIESFAKSFVNLIVVDTVQFLTPDDILNNSEVQENKYKILSNLFEMIIPIITKTGTTVIFINHKQMKTFSKYFDLIIGLDVDKQLKNAYGYHGNRLNLNTIKNIKNIKVAKQIKLFFGSHVELLS